MVSVRSAWLCRSGYAERLLCIWCILLVPFVLFSVLSLANNSGQNPELEFRVEKANCEIKIDIQFFNDLRTTPRFFADSEQGGIPCIDSHGDSCEGPKERPFYGAAAIVHFEVETNSCKTPLMKLREQVRVIDQDSTLPEWKPFAKTIALPKGLGSDIQLFGYYPESVHAQLEPPPRPSGSPWRFLHQDLFFGDEPNPFLILHWKHTLGKVMLVDIIPVGTTRLQKIRK